MLGMWIKTTQNNDCLVQHHPLKMRPGGHNRVAMTTSTFRVGMQWNKTNGVLLRDAVYVWSRMFLESTMTAMVHPRTQGSLERLWGGQQDSRPSKFQFEVWILLKPVIEWQWLWWVVGMTCPSYPLGIPPHCFLSPFSLNAHPYPANEQKLLA